MTMVKPKTDISFTIRNSNSSRTCEMGKIYMWNYGIGVKLDIRQIQ
jgi:hypothetical protein